MIRAAKSAMRADAQKAWRTAGDQKPACLREGVPQVVPGDAHLVALGRLEPEATGLGLLGAPA